MILLGTRGSPLALAQAQLVVAGLARAAPEVEVEIRVIQSEGDLRPTADLSEPGVDGWFTSRLQAELTAGRVDGAVHSAKDLPSQAAAPTVVGAYLERADPRDVIITRAGAGWRELPPGARVGTSSPRRAAQLLGLRPDLDPVPVRGNVQTRIARVEDGSVEAVVLAAAGLARLGLTDLGQPLDPVAECTPAPAQGAIAVEVRDAGADWLRALDHQPTRTAVEAERRLLALMGGGCRLALGALAEQLGDGSWRLSAAFAPEGAPAAVRRLTLRAPHALGLGRLVDRAAVALREAG